MSSTRPDPDTEERWRDRIATLLADAPEPDGHHLGMQLAVARARARQARGRRRLLRWAGGLALLGCGAAAAGWLAHDWVGGEPAADRTPAEGRATGAGGSAAERARPEQTDDPRDEDAADEAANGETRDGPIIYRRSR